MDSARWKRLQELFHRALELGEADRRGFLEDECRDDSTIVAEVLGLIDADGRLSLLDGNLSGVVDEVFGVRTAGALSSRRLGPYRIERLLGEGGMGVVYLAERDDLQTKVAIKVLPDAWVSPARRARFVREQRMLARLNHPSIARIYDANTLDDGTPWFAMEYVEGVALTDHCAQHDCSIEERLRLFRSACEAVRYAHDTGIIHRDLKPAHVLIKADGSVRLLDFGIAKPIEALGIAAERTQTGLRLMTPAYAAPERIRGGPADPVTDVYSLGVILYELLVGRMPFDLTDLTPDAAATRLTETEPERPSLVARRAAHAGTGARPAMAARSSWADLDVLCLTAMHREPQRRYPSVDALIHDLDHFLRSEPLDARPDRVGYRLGKHLRRNRRALSASAAALAVMGALAFTVGRSAGPRRSPGAAPSTTRTRTVAVLPFQNLGSEADLDFLRAALPDEIATSLSSSRSLVVRPFEATSRYAGAGLNLSAVGRDLAVDALVTGHFSSGADGLRVALELVDVGANRVLWRDTLQSPAPGLLAMKEKLLAATRGGLATALGATADPVPSLPHPRSEEAYDLYLRSAALRYDPGPNAQGLSMMERAVALDPGYAPAWLALARRYYVEARFGDTDNVLELMERYVGATERALALDPEYITAAARLTAYYTEKGELVRAYRMGRDLVRRRPDNPEAHFWLSYVLRYAGLLEEAARECETALSIDPHNFGWRSCASVALARGDPEGAMAYLNLDAGSEYQKAMAIHVLVWKGREQEALQIERPRIPGWKSIDMLLACLERRPATEIAALAASVGASDDPESTYRSAAHLAYCGQTTAALVLLRRAIQAGYCAFPALDTDRLLASLRHTPDFAAIRALAVACQARFLVERGATP